MEPISIIMPVLGQSQYTQAFFDTFTDNTSGEYELIVINNGDDQETKDILSHQMSINPRIRVIVNKENTGVAASWNQGIAESVHDYICIVNNDIEFLSVRWNAEMQQMLIKNPEVYWTSPSVMYTKDRHKMCFKIHHYEQLKYEHSQDAYAPYVVGCCFMCPRKACDTIGVFDEQFDIKYYEDLDFINRILQNGNRVKMTKSAIIYHAVGTTSRKTPGGDDNVNLYEEKWGESPYNIMAKQAPRVKGIKHFPANE